MDTDDAIELLGVLALFALILLLIALGPLVTIWALNTLFGLKIAFTFWTWLAVLWLSAAFGAISYKKS